LIDWCLTSTLAIFQQQCILLHVEFYNTMRFFIDLILYLFNKDCQPPIYYWFIVDLI